MRSIFGDSAADPETGTVAERLGTVEQWRSYLAEYGADVLRVSAEGELFNVSDEQRATGWLGYEGADEQRIAALEDRLGTRLPPSYRSFLGASDGWSHLGPFMYEMCTIGALDWLDDDDADMYMDTHDDEPDDASKRVRPPSCSSRTRATPSCGCWTPGTCRRTGSGPRTPGRVGNRV